MNELYLEIFNSPELNNEIIELNVPLETLLIYFVYQEADPNLFTIIFVRKDFKNDDNILLFTISIKKDSNYTIIDETQLPVLTSYCFLPLAITNFTVIAGLCSVARQIIKSCESREIHKLLGFREACLIACNESSIWTKFCEVDMIQTVKNLFQKCGPYFKDNVFMLPDDLTRFENHLSEPVRIHNVYKVAQDHAKLQNLNITDITTVIPKEKLNLEHVYSEGPYMTLADIILYPMVHIFIRVINETIIETKFPLILKWYNKMQSHIDLIEIKLPFDVTTLISNCSRIIQMEIKPQSLYITDPKRYQPKNRIYTKQTDIQTALEIIKTLDIAVPGGTKPYGFEVNFNWDEIPLEANPEGGALPKSRMKRKCEQLENLAKAVIKIAKEKQVIVDFCSGSGHLGILLAVKLPYCKIILLENKEMSLNRARERIKKLKLQNVTLLQCNLDYFKGEFDIGTSLHACGVATDLVIRHCTKKRAAFVSCPCCYGSVHVCHHLSYPRSQFFRDSPLSLKDYLVLGHSADQTHDLANAKTNQGIECMHIIDSDRKLHAEELGYDVFLGKMVPETCSPKNNLIVGIPKEYKFENIYLN